MNSKRFLSLLLCLFVFAAFAYAQTSNPPPAGPAAPHNKDDLPVTLKKGQSHDNGAVKVDVDAKSDGNVRVTPKVAREGLPTVVDFFNKAKGVVTGLSAGETVNVTNDAKADVTGDGGTVNLSGGGASVHVTNTAPLGSNKTIKVLGKDGGEIGSYGPGESGTSSNP